MDRSRFDELARTWAFPASRRRVLGRLGMSAAAGLLALLGAGAAAEPRRCRKAGQTCPRHVKSKPCCSGVCCGDRCCAEGESCTEAGCCPQIQSCGDLCCPPETVGCSEKVLPDGTAILGCLCKEGTKYKPVTNQCVPCPVACASDDECCEGLCCNGTCCAGTCCGDKCVAEAGCPVCCDGACCPSEANGFEPHLCVDGKCVPCTTAHGGACGADRPCCDGVCYGNTCCCNGYEFCGGKPCCTAGGFICVFGECVCPGPAPCSYCLVCTCPVHLP
jgi:hypothetical protein